MDTDELRFEQPPLTTVHIHLSELLAKRDIEPQRRDEHREDKKAESLQ